MSKMTEAIAAHRAAWQAFQDAPADARRAEGAMHQAEDDLMHTVPADAADLEAFKAHLDWYVVEEAEQLGGIVRALHATITLAIGAGWQDGFLTCEQHYQDAEIAAVTKARILMEAVDFDNNGAMVAGQLVGGNGGLLSRDTIKAADELRKALPAVPR